MDYKILLPVTNNPELVEDKLHEVDLERLILVNNFENPEVELLCRQAEDGGAEVHRYPRNLGLAASWNLGLRRMKEEECDFVIILSASAVFEGEIIERFVEGIAKYEIAKGRQSRYLASSKATLHCFAQTSKSVDLGGYFDENFWPIYCEDTDYCRRSVLNGVHLGVVQLRLDDLVRSRGFSIAMKDRRLMRLLQLNQARMGEYYVNKWGGVQGSEVYITPFDDPSLGVNDWTVDPKIFIWPEGVYEGDFEPWG